MNKSKTIWFDLDNSPHVPLFIPLIKELETRGFKVIVTAREYAQTTHLLELWNINYTKIGKHGGKNKINKIVNLFYRALQLIFFIKKHTADLAVSHGSRTQVIAAKILRIQSVLMLDYEYTEAKIFNLFSDKLLMPIYIPEQRLKTAGFNLSKVIRYNGFKEELYLNNFVPDISFRDKLNIPNSKILITLRPSAMISNYHNPLSETVILQILEQIVIDERCYPLIVSRTKEDKTLLQSKFGNKIHFLESAVDGLQLIWNSDIFISGGGTMNREAALLDVPTYSVFTGAKPFLDEMLADEGKMVFIDEINKIEQFKIAKRNISEKYYSKNNHVVSEVSDILIKLLK